MLEATQVVPELIVQSVSRALRFYVDVLGMVEIARAPETDEPKWAEVKGGSAHLMLQERNQLLEEMPSLASREIGGTILIVLRTRDASTVARIEPMIHATEVVLPRRTTDYGTTEFGFLDPDGYVVLLSVVSE